MVIAVARAADACCCTCENSTECFPVCTSELFDSATCDAACMHAGCGHVQPCPNPSGGEGCSAGEVSCFDVSGAAAPAPALSTGGLIVAAMLIAAAGCLSLARRARRP
jgi:hypothetical protein